VKESTTMATPTIRFQGRADVDLGRVLRCFAGETGVTSMQIEIHTEDRDPNSDISEPFAIESLD
jgi:hypothetical protein